MVSTSATYKLAIRSISCTCSCSDNIHITVYMQVTLYPDDPQLVCSTTHNGQSCTQVIQKFNEVSDHMIIVQLSVAIDNSVIN